MRRLVSRGARALRRRPLEAVLAAVVVATTFYVVVFPFTLVRYPPLTDFPFHAANTSVLLHWADPAWHFREQFTLQPFAVPYLSMYAVGAALMLFLPAVAAVKVAAVLMLLLLPAGLAVMFRGMKKSALLGVLGLFAVWGNLTHWGFLNFVGALGLFAMAVGLALALVDRPSRAKQVALCLVLVALFFTHVFRFPFAVAAVVGTALVMYPATRRLAPIVAPLLPPVALFAAWLWVRPDELGLEAGLAMHPERLDEIPGLLFGAFVDPREQSAVRLALRVLVGSAVVALVAGLLERRAFGGRRLAWRAGATLVPVSCALVFLGFFLVLPMQMGVWWYVYPREATAAAFLALGAFPELPQAGLVRAAVIVALAASAANSGSVVVNNWAPFDRATEDFRAVTREIPAAPKLLYLVFDHSGSSRTTTPFIHLPAYVQAERGGWLSFHFAVWGASPVVYRDRSEPGAVVPPAVPIRWEWTPHLFQVKKHGAFFDWFLVRQRGAPDRLFEADPSIERVAHEGSWWLYRRVPAPAPEERAARSTP